VEELSREPAPSDDAREFAYSMNPGEGAWEENGTGVIDSLASLISARDARRDAELVERIDTELTDRLTSWDKDKIMSIVREAARSKL
jgi:hypothetical protein